MQTRIPNTATKWNYIKYLFVIYWLYMFDARSLKYNVPRTATMNVEKYYMYYFFDSVKRKWQENEKRGEKLCVETGLSFFYYFFFVLSVLSVFGSWACWLIWWMPPNNVRLLFIRCIFVLYICHCFLFLGFNVASFCFFLSPIHIHLSSMPFCNTISFFSFFRSFVHLIFLFFWHFRIPLTP